MSSAIAIMQGRSMQNAFALEAAAAYTGVPLHIAAAFAEKESNGRNIYGHDSGGTFNDGRAVTAINYAEFYRLVILLGQRSNGVGPMQITYKGYLTQARERNLRLYVPFENMVFGLRIIRGSLNGSYTKASIEKAATLYNKGNFTTGVNTYGRDAYIKSEAWGSRFAGASRPIALRVGSRGPEVVDLQAGLLRRFPSYAGPIRDSGGADGIYGRATESVVKEFQVRVKMAASDGIVDTWTRGQLSAYGIEWT